MPLYTTVCPRNCYSTCTIKVEVEQGHVRRILPFEGNRATPEGPCLKGLSYVERLSAANRGPQQEVGEKFAIETGVHQ